MFNFSLGAVPSEDCNTEVPSGMALPFKILMLFMSFSNNLLQDVVTFFNKVLIILK